MWERGLLCGRDGCCVGWIVWEIGLLCGREGRCVGERRVAPSPLRLQLQFGLQSERAVFPIDRQQALVAFAFVTSLYKMCRVFFTVN